MILAGAALNQTPLDWENNLLNIKNSIEEAKKQNAALLCLPELAITGYGCEDLFLSDWLPEFAFEKLLEVKEWCDGITVCVGIPIRMGRNVVYNTACVIQNKEIIGFTAKQFLANEGVHYEPRWFTSWIAGTESTFEKFGKTYKIGDLVYALDGVKFAFEICEDAWRGDDRPAGRLVERGVQLIVNPSASHFAMSKTDVRYHLVVDASKKYNCAYLYVNLLGNEAGKMIYDGEILIAQNGNLIERNGLLCFKSVDISCAEVDFTKPLPVAETIAKLPPIDENKEFIAAITLAMFDYLRKARSKGFVLSLSGGADSSACAVIVAEMVKRVLRELGLEEFARKTNVLSAEDLQQLEFLNDFEKEKFLTGKLLTCAYQGTVNSSDQTFQSAEELAKSIGAVFYNWTIDEEVSSYTGKIETAIGRNLTWQTDDITLQNIQARVRAPAIWMLANIKHALLLATSNRSEAAVGYATMDGDTAGSISPLAGVDKAFLRQWLIWAQQNLGYEGLQYVNNLQPTAELRPAEQTQTDEKDLMPYPILNQIERLAFFERLSPEQVFERLKVEVDKESLKVYLNRFYSLWSRNQWKRERYAPAFHLDDYNLDPRSWLRFPILSGGFKEELKKIN